MPSVETEPSRTAVFIAIAMDVLLAVLLGAVALLILAGPGIYEPFGVRLKLRTADNPVTIALALALLRVWFFPSIAVLGFAHPPASLQRLHEALSRFTSQSDNHALARRLVLICVAASFVARAFQAWLHPGFATGDDVEIHEMTLRTLLGKDWPVWDLRSAFYPLTVVYPAQALAHMFGADVQALVVAGRASVVLAATGAVWLTWVAAKPMLGERLAAVAAALVAINKLHLSYGSSELPRPVAATLLVGAFALLSRRESLASAVAGGGLIGIAAALRFSEAMFVVPAALHLWLAGRRVHAGILTAVAAAVACAITAATDAVYWGSAFHSLTHALDYTLLDKQSSRGFQPFYYYLSALQNWTNWILAGLACLAWRERALRPAVLWAILPIAILSALPHKESRYLIPVVPFVAICAAAGIARAAEWTRTARSPRLREALIVALAAAMLYELGGWRLRRSNDAVALAQFIRETDPVSGVGVEQLWQAGGALYLSGRSVLVDVREEEVPKALRSPDLTWLALKVDTVNRHQYEPVLSNAGWRRHARFGDYDLFQRPRP
jgi:hypothetical protein